MRSRPSTAARQRGAWVIHGLLLQRSWLAAASCHVPPAFPVTDQVLASPAADQGLCRGAHGAGPAAAGGGACPGPRGRHLWPVAPAGGDSWGAGERGARWVDSRARRLQEGESSMRQGECSAKERLASRGVHKLWQAGRHAGVHACRGGSALADVPRRQGCGPAALPRCAGTRRHGAHEPAQGPHGSGSRDHFWAGALLQRRQRRWGALKVRGQAGRALAAPLRACYRWVLRSCLLCCLHLLSVLAPADNLRPLSVLAPAVNACASLPPSPLWLTEACPRPAACLQPRPGL